jgi:hypothetical protein
MTLAPTSVMIGSMGRDETSEANPPAARGPASAPSPEPSRTCPNCGAPLLERKCKLICPNAQCGYYMSCSDFL